MLHEVGRALVAGGEQHGDGRQEPGDRPDRGGHQLGADARHAREIDVRRRGPNGIAESGVPEQPPQAERDDRYHDEDEHLARGDLDVEAGMPGPGEWERELRLQGPSPVLGQGERDGLAQLGDPDRRDEHDDARRAEQTPDHGELDDGAGQRSHQQRADERGPVGPVVLAGHDGEQRGRGDAHVADREVDDSVRPVDEHDAHRDQRDDHSADDTLEEQVPRDDGREHQPPSVPKNTARARSSRSSRSRACAFEPHLTLLEEDRTIGDRERDIERLLDDDHRLTARLEVLDDFQESLHHDRREARATARRSSAARARG